MNLRISRDMISVEYDRFLQANGIKPKQGKNVRFEGQGADFF